MLGARDRGAKSHVRRSRSSDIGQKLDDVEDDRIDALDIIRSAWE
jgi:hypothetical protein